MVVLGSSLDLDSSGIALELTGWENGAQHERRGSKPRRSPSFLEDFDLGYTLRHRRDIGRGHRPAEPVRRRHLLRDTLIDIAVEGLLQVLFSPLKVLSVTIGIVVNVSDRVLAGLYQLPLRFKEGAQCANQVDKFDHRASHSDTDCSLQPAPVRCSALGANVR